MLFSHDFICSQYFGSQIACSLQAEFRSSRTPPQLGENAMAAKEMGMAVSASRAREGGDCADAQSSVGSSRFHLGPNAVIAAHAS